MKLIDFIVCDDIRREIGNKITLVGMYNNKIQLQGPMVAWPVAIAFSVYVRLKIENDEDRNGTKFSLIVAQEGKQLQDLTGEIKFNNDLEAFQLLASLPPMPFNVGPVDFQIHISKNDEVLHKLAPPFTFSIEHMFTTPLPDTKTK